MEETIHYSLNLIKGGFAERNVDVIISAPSAKPIFFADVRACRQIMLNLIVNAVKFSRPGGKVRVAVSYTERTARLLVSDNGVGIPANAMSRIGHAFEQASNSPGLAREGTGLGLALVRALVARHSGTFLIESQENVGTTVTVELPLNQKQSEVA